MAIHTKPCRIHTVLDQLNHDSVQTKEFSLFQRKIESHDKSVCYTPRENNQEKILRFFIQSDFSDFTSKWIFSSELVLEPSKEIFFLFITVTCEYSSWSGNGVSTNQKMQIRREQNRKIAKQPYKTQSKMGKFLSKIATFTRLCSVISINGKVVRG